VKEIFSSSNCFHVDVQILRNVRELACLDKKVGVVDEGDRAEGAGVVLRPHPAAIKNAAVEKELMSESLRENFGEKRIQAEERGAPLAPLEHRCRWGHCLAARGAPS
jgi:hypothetical protein